MRRARERRDKLYSISFKIPARLLYVIEKAACKFHDCNRSELIRMALLDYIFKLEELNAAMEILEKRWENGEDREGRIYSIHM